MIVEVNIPNIDDVRRHMAGMENKAELAMSRAINRTITYVNTLIVKESRSKYVVKAPDIKKTLTIRRAKPKRLSGEVTSTSKKKVKLYGFKVDPPQPGYKSPPQVYSSQVLKESGMVGLTGSSDRSKGFVAKMHSGHVGVFQRQIGSGSKGVQTIAELFGPSIPSMIKSGRVSQVVHSKGGGYLRNRLDVEINAIMRGYVK